MFWHKLCFFLNILNYVGNVSKYLFYNLKFIKYITYINFVKYLFYSIFIFNVTKKNLLNLVVSSNNIWFVEILFFARFTCTWECVFLFWFVSIQGVVVFFLTLCSKIVELCLYISLSSFSQEHTSRKTICLFL